MKTKHVNLALAVAMGMGGSLATSAACAAGPTVYGYFNVSLDHLDNEADSALNVSSNSSHIGVKGDVEIQESLKAVYQVETEIRADIGGGAWATRDTFLGLAGKFGTVRAGQIDTPVKTIGRRVEMFGNQVGDSRNLTRVAAGDNIARFDERPKNSIAYATPKFSGLQGFVQYSTNAAPTATADGTAANNDSDLISVAAYYAEGPAFFGVGYESVGNPANLGGTEDPSAIRIGGFYDISSDLRVAALYQTVSGTDAAFDQDVYGLGVRYKVSGPWILKAQTYQLSGEGNDSDATLLALGIDYALAKPVTIYLNYAAVDNDAGRSLTAWGQGHGDTGLAPGAGTGDSATGLSLGSIVRF